jgi:hypothetical protein
MAYLEAFYMGRFGGLHQVREYKNSAERVVTIESTARLHDVCNGLAFRGYGVAKRSTVFV